MKPKLAKEKGGILPVAALFFDSYEVRRCLLSAIPVYREYNRKRDYQLLQFITRRPYCQLLVPQLYIS